MDAREKQQLLESLDTGREALLAAVAGLTEDLAGRAPGPGRWSVRECVEHLFLVEDYLFAQVTSSKPSDAPVGSRARENSILKRAADRSRPLEAPEMVRPTGRFTTLTEALQAFTASRDQTIRYVHALQEDPRSRTAHHPLLGPVNCYETLLIIALHPHRHAQQIGEIRQSVSATR
jgi:DinB family protein